MTRRTGAVTACAAAMLVCSANPGAQIRFHVVSQQALAEVPGLRIVSLRDDLLSACYTLFIMESTVVPQNLPLAVSPTTLTEDARERIRVAKDSRDQQLTDLRSRMRAPNPLDPTNGEAEFETQRQKVEAEFLQAVRRELPGSLAWSSPMAGGRTSTADETAELVRRALLESDSTARDANIVNRLAALDELMRKFIEVPRMTASGPVICADPPVRQPAR